MYYGEERKAWLDTLQVGDTVYNIEYSWSQIRAVRQYIIKTITPQRRFRLDDGTLLDTNGVKRGDYLSYRILPMCDTIQKAITEVQTKNLYREVCDKLSRISMVNLDLPKLEILNKVIDEMNQPKQGDK